MNAQGRVTLPAEVRKKLHLAAGDQLEVAVEEDRITLRPARVVVAEDAWAYTAENLALIRRALDDSREGRVYRLTWQDLERIGRTGKLPRRSGRAASKRKSA
ncbi:MAG: AbrB/MazE/SpoVT family DNA-binding domain-containing protein [Candidatus Limnocylindria bacterium]